MSDKSSPISGDLFHISVRPGANLRVINITLCVSKKMIIVLWVKTGMLSMLQTEVYTGAKIWQERQSDQEDLCNFACVCVMIKQWTTHRANLAICYTRLISAAT